MNGKEGNGTPAGGMPAMGGWALAAALAGLVLALWLEFRPMNAVVVYCAQDQAYAGQVFRLAEEETGIRVLPVYDSEAVKTVGLANRLIAERDHPRADLFWGNEELRARQLAARDIFLETNGLAFFGDRTRCLVVNTQLWRGMRGGVSLMDLTNSSWQGKVAIAYPQFGTTAAHFHALRQHWGDAAWTAWCRNLAANRPIIVDGNSVVVQMVASGEAHIGLTDSDDVLAGIREGRPVAALPLAGETLHIPNTVGRVRGGPHPEAARRLAQFLCGPRVAAMLVECGALNGVAPDPNLPGLAPVWGRILTEMDATTEGLNRIFLR